MDSARHDDLLQHYGVGPGDELGHGGEAIVYALDDHRVLRVHRQEAGAQARALAELYAALDRRAVPYALPEILEVHGDGETSWAIERRLPGRSLDGLIGELRGTDRAHVLAVYVDGAAAFGALPVPSSWPGGYGELFTAEALRADRWGALLADRLGRQLDIARPLLERTVPDLDVDVVRSRVLEAAMAEPDDEPVLVHGDWFPGNVLVGDDLEVSAVIDLGWLTVVGDRSHDVRSAVVFFEVRPWLQPGDEEVLVAAAARHLGSGAADQIDRTRCFEQARFAFVEDDHHLHQWCVTGLQQVASLAG